MLMTNLHLLLIIGALGGMLFIGLNWLLSAVMPQLKQSVELLLRRLPQRWQQRLNEAAQQTTAHDDTANFIIESGAMLLTVIVSLIVPVPGWISALVCGLVVLRILHNRMQRKIVLQRFEKQWPNCLDMLAMLMQAGLSFPAALHTLAQLPSSSVAIRQLRQLQQQLHAGVTLEAAFSALKIRLPSVAFAAFAAAVIQSRRSGSALTTTLLLQAEQARNEQQLAAEKFAQEVGIKLLLPLVTCFFPVTFILILAPIAIGYL